MYHSPGSIITTASICEVSIGVGASSVIPPCLPASAGSSVQLSFNSKVGAALVLPQGASRENLLPESHFREFVRHHAEDWYNFAEASGYLGGADTDAGEDLFVVTGCDKTSSWGIATASSLSTTVGFSLKLELVGLVEGKLEPRFEWHRITTSAVRLSSSKADDLQNQCVFVLGFTIPKQRRGSWWKYALNRVGRPATPTLSTRHQRQAVSPVEADGSAFTQVNRGNS
ncbi:hypothetical protein MIND_00286800 [Mycena indigotica]|uniref:Uncharacterized protein n=1 Tax=Mycena indigotica TaxID=2126181 RepID=A0A8H6T880_9AGAR|nr:uncharacterized protein MIND_00286800 [Mycena indigotica]KAF7312720.1 hypothetical protein MIND_00286800 [Mycena indigotica]